MIPDHLVIDNILPRLPSNSLALCRCVSKLWSSMIRRPNYDLLFPVKSPAPPRLLWAVEDAGDLLICSSPQPQNLDQNFSLDITLHHTHSSKDFYKLCRPVGGLICLQHIEKEHIEKDHTFAVICNPITGESLTLPKQRKERIKSEWKDGKAAYSFGYDPIDKQFKVLCVTWSYRGSQNWPGQYQVLTLGTGKENLLWRKIQCHTSHYALEDNGICINGVLYYPAKTFSGNYTVVCFDVRSEKFSFINIAQELATKMDKPFVLVDYKSKLGAGVEYVREGHFELCVLDDAEEHRWSKMKHLGPIHFVKKSERAAAVVCPQYYVNGPFYFFWGDLEINKQIRVRVEFLDLEACCRVHTFSNFVEDEKLM
ncbi:unnamed protein product [Microthlaspi erraticum]|uniref:F-box associated beta-propeller type 3 domain-containing protein n=1 Tax=Microthlaspi erraticum TaxID=1685480 RepID=A0A6D2HQE1_9BRAS|nr:unnamed protein product [Microthlaspi erraticum]